MTNEALRAWVRTVAEYARPSKIHWCNGTDIELRALQEGMLEDRTFIRLNDQKYPRCFLHRSDPGDVARADGLTFICTRDEADAGPTNNWMSEADAYRIVWPLFANAMYGRTLYVVPYLMGPPGSSYSRVGVQLTDSPYVVANLAIMTRMGDVALEHLGDSAAFTRGLHSLGDMSPDRRYVVHFPSTRRIWSIGSAYGCNALLSKKCHGLRLASVEGRDEGWLAEHTLILGITSPQGTKRYIAAALPSACGKASLSTLMPTLPGWHVETVAHDIAWMHVGEDGRLWAINPEAGMFGVAPGTSPKANPNAVDPLTHDVIFTDVALRDDGTPWWEGMGRTPRDGVQDWRGRRWTPESVDPAAHPNARFTVGAKQWPNVSADIDAPRGVPISAILFGSRRAKMTPLVYETLGWTHGVYVGATLVSETLATAGADRVARNDPMAMLSFCGYHMGDYFAHWLRVGEKLRDPPRIFHVNWFRTDHDGGYLWPGFGENIRVLKWILERVDGTADVRATSLGFVPEDLELSGLGMSAERIAKLHAIDPVAWRREAVNNASFLAQFGDRLPEPLKLEHNALLRRLDHVSS